MADSAEEAQALLSKFTASNRPKSRGSMPAQGRVEKGTFKVNDHEVKKTAVKLLYTLIEGYEIEEPDVRKAFLKHATKDAERIISDFGFDKNKIQTEGVQDSAEIIKGITRSRDIEELKKECDLLRSSLESISQNVYIDRDAGTDSGNEVRNTRRGGNLKRSRNVQDASDCMEKMTALLKRVRE